MRTGGSIGAKVGWSCLTHSGEGCSLDSNNETSDEQLKKTHRGALSVSAVP